MKSRSITVNPGSPGILRGQGKKSGINAVAKRKREGKSLGSYDQMRRKTLKEIPERGHARKRRNTSHQT